MHTLAKFVSLSEREARGRIRTHTHPPLTAVHCPARRPGHLLNDPRRGRHTSDLGRTLERGSRVPGSADASLERRAEFSNEHVRQPQSKAGGGGLWRVTHGE